MPYFLRAYYDNVHGNYTSPPFTDLEEIRTTAKNYIKSYKHMVRAEIYQIREDLVEVFTPQTPSPQDPTGIERKDDNSK